MICVKMMFISPYDNKNAMGGRLPGHSIRVVQKLLFYALNQ